MTQWTNGQLAALAQELVDAAARKNLTLRVLGGVAIYMTCSSIETRPTLQRTPHDLDLVAARKDWDALAETFAARGVTVRAKEAEHWVFDKDSVEIELCNPIFRHADLSARLALASPTLPLADLLLIKLQRVKFAEWDIQDSIALLLDHRVAPGEAQGQIDQEYIARLCAWNWGLFHAVYDNTVALEKVLDRHVEPEEAQLVWRRIELIQGDMDQQPKSLGWMLNQIFRKPTQVPA